MNDAFFTCIVVGGGHAGCEAAVALARMGIGVLLVSGNLDRLGYLSCNPAIGGLAKGHMVREIDALGGMMGIWADSAGIQFRTLNASKGPAVRATRAQMDRATYQQSVKRTVLNTPGLQVWQDNATAIISGHGRVSGIKTAQGLSFGCDHVLLTTGTFLEGMMHMGDVSIPGGRFGDAPSRGLSASLTEHGLKMGRLKTGTTPRLSARTVDYSRMEIQPGDSPEPHFSFHARQRGLPQLPCHITWTNGSTHEIIRGSFGRSPLFTGKIKGVGARYCPSIEDKVARFPDRERHQIFIEPEGLDCLEVYANGISTSLPIDVQREFIHSIAGLENAQILRPGYAIEYDYANPVQLYPTLESKTLEGLWLAGQINGTSGYEEAAAQGLWAAANMACRVKDEPPFILQRSQAYMAVLVDDLVTLGTEEPYRMFTSRAEHRLLLREDNADERLTPIGRRLGLVDEQQWAAFCERQEKISRLKTELGQLRVPAQHPAGQLCAGLPAGQAITDILRRPDMDLGHMAASMLASGSAPHMDIGRRLSAIIADVDDSVLGSVLTDIKYAGYLQRQRELVARSSRLECTPLPNGLDYAKVAGLSREMVEKLSRIRPANLGQAGRISGVTPAALGCLEIHLHKLGLLKPCKKPIRHAAAPEVAHDISAKH